MIAYLKGTLEQVGFNEVVVDVGGVGYGLVMSQLAIATLPPVGEEVKIITYLSVSDSGVALFGFADNDEEFLFRKLIAVSGIGPKMALAALSRFTPAELISAIVAEDSKAVCKIPGVGKKLASRMILELKDTFPSDGIVASVTDDTDTQGAFIAVKDALLSMGFTTSEIDAALAGAPRDEAEGGLLKYALKRLGS